MKKIAFSIFCVLLTKFAIGQDAVKQTLIVFSGSDWCKPCIQLKEETLNNDSLIHFLSEKNITIQIADFPRKKANKPSKEVIKQNDQLAELYNQEGAFPKLILIDPKQQLIYSKKGFINSSDLITELNAIL